MSYFHPLSEASSISFTKNLEVASSKPPNIIYTNSYNKTYIRRRCFIYFKNLNTSSSFMCHFQLWLILPPAPDSISSGNTAFLSFITNLDSVRNLTVGPEYACSSHLRAGIKEGLTEFSFSCSPSPLGREDRLFVEFLFGVEVMAPAFFFTVSTSQLAWSSLCVLFPALITL